MKHCYNEDNNQSSNQPFSLFIFFTALQMLQNRTHENIELSFAKSTVDMFICLASQFIFKRLMCQQTTVKILQIF